MSWEYGVDKDFKQSPQFFRLFTAITSAGLFLTPNGPTFKVIAWLTVVIMLVLTFIMTLDMAVP